MNRAYDFDVALKTVGIPINGVSGSGPNCRIDFKPEATDEQRKIANTMRSTFNWMPRKPRAVMSVAQDIENWIGTDAGKARKAASLALAIAALATGNLESLKKLTNVDGNEPP